MKDKTWESAVQELVNKYRLVSEFQVGDAKGYILHSPIASEVRGLISSLLKYSWKNGICCQHLYRPEIEKAMDLNYERIGIHGWRPSESWIALFEIVGRDQIFPIIGHLCDEFTKNEVALIEELFSDIEWCTPLIASGRSLEVAVSDSFENEVDLEKWFFRYREVSCELYGHSRTKSDFKRSLSRGRSLFFMNMR